MRLSMLTVALSVAVVASRPVCARDSGISEIRITPEQVGELKELVQLKSVRGQTGSVTDGSLGSALIAAVMGRGECRHEQSREAHGVPMCAVPLSDGFPPNYVYVRLSGSGRREPRELVVHRETRMFPIGKSALSDFEHWASAEISIKTDSDGRVIDAFRTIPAICPAIPGVVSAETVCPGAAIQPYQVQEGAGERTVLIGRTRSPLSAAETRDELERTLAAVRAKPR